MYSYSEGTKKIGQLQNAANLLEENARNAGRGLTRKETALIEDINNQVEEIRRETPANAPMTLQGSFRNTSVSTGPFSSLGEQLSCIARASSPGGHADPRLYNATGLGETIPSDGGFLVQKDFSNEILQEMWDTARLASRCKRVQLSGNSNSLILNGVDETSRAAGSRSGGVRGYWIGEAEEITASKPKFRRIELSLKKVAGLVYCTDEMLSDSSAMESTLKDAVVSELRFLVDDAIINGTGAGQPLGFLNSGALVTVQPEAGQAPATIIAENVFRMHQRLLPGSEATACWFINKDCLYQLYQMGVQIGVGGSPVFVPDRGISGRPFDTLLGLPIIPIEQAATLGTVGDITLADLSNGYILAEKGGIKADMSIHVKFVYSESVFRFVLRIDGQPVRASAVTPYKGSDTLSHFVCLATRA